MNGFCLFGMSMAAACSDFLLNTSSSDLYISARTMDYEIDLQTVLEIIPQGTLMEEAPIFDCPDCPNYAWNTTVGYVAFNPVGENYAVDGMNQHGLSAGWLYLTGSEYPNVENDLQNTKPIITNLCAYVLGTYATVAQVQAGLTEIQVGEVDGRVMTFLTGVKGYAHFPLHLTVHDALGKSLVVEFMHGKMHVYENSGGVLTNAPVFAWHNINRKVFQYSPVAMPGDYTSASRFLRLWALNQRATVPYTPNTSYAQATPTQAAIARAFRIIHTVVRPPGVTDTSTVPAFTGTTQWTVLRDHSNLVLYFTSAENEMLRSVDLKRMDFTKLSSRNDMPITKGPFSFDMTDQLTHPKISQHTGDLPPRIAIEKALSSGQIASTTTNTTVLETPTSVVLTSPSQWGFVSGMVLGSISTLGVLWATRSATHGGYQSLSQ